jgi:hypothetical protein
MSASTYPYRPSTRKERVYQITHCLHLQVILITLIRSPCKLHRGGNKVNGAHWQFLYMQHAPLSRLVPPSTSLFPGPDIICTTPLTLSTSYIGLQEQSAAGSWPIQNCTEMLCCNRSRIKNKSRLSA